MENLTFNLFFFLSVYSIYVCFILGKGVRRVLFQFYLYKTILANLALAHISDKEKNKEQK